ncbi:flagellar biosynthesis anti-sigma factor FlgM [Sporosarcina sp. CAU 1771]
MKINKVNLPVVNPYQSNQLKADQAGKKQATQTDRLEISQEAKQLSEVSSYSLERNERVQQIKSQVDSGTYEVDAKKLAANILDYYNK